MVKIRALPLLLALTALACAFPAMADSRSGPISTLQWYWNDGNWSSAQSQILTPGTDITFSASFSAVDLPAGLNWLHYRVKDNAGKTSIPQHLTFYRPDRQTPDPVSRLEYFADNDPGLGQATQIDLVDGTDVQQAFQINMGEGGIGFRNVGVRVQNSAGLWSQLHWTLLLRPGFPNVADISSINWYFTGSGANEASTTVSAGITPGQNPTVNEAIPLTQLVQGQAYLMHLSVISTRGKHSQEYIHPFTVNWIPQNVEGSVAGQLFTLSWDAIYGATGYKVLAGTTPGSYTLLGTTPNTWWQETAINAKFFRVVAVRN